MVKDFRDTHGKKIRVYFFFGLLLAVTFTSLYVFGQFLAPFIVAGVLAVLFHPIHNRIAAKMPAKIKWLAAVITLVVATVAILIPLSLLGIQVASEIQDLSINGGEVGIAEQVNTAVNTLVQRFLPDFSFDIEAVVANIVNIVRQNIGSIFTSVAQFLLNFFLMFTILYFLLKDGHRFKQTLVKLSPLSDSNDEQIFDRLKVAVNSVVKGSLLIGLVQGVVAFIGFNIFSVPNPALLGGLTAIAALIPGIGTSLILIPVIAFLFISGDTGNAIGMLIWGVAAVGVVDNFLGPVFIGRGIHIHPLIILLAVLGGIAVFGPIGFLIGPLLIAFNFALLDIYAADFDE